MNGRIVKIVWKDEGDFGFIGAFTDTDMAYREANPGKIGVPFDPDRVRAYGSLAEAQALADEHGVPLEVS